MFLGHWCPEARRASLSWSPFYRVWKVSKCSPDTQVCLPEPTTGQRKCLSPWPAMTPAWPWDTGHQDTEPRSRLCWPGEGGVAPGRRPEDQGLTLTAGICKWDPQTHSITWKLIRNTNSPTSPHTSEIYICGSGTSNMATGVPKQWNFFYVCTQVWELWPVPHPLTIRMTLQSRREREQACICESHPGRKESCWQHLRQWRGLGFTRELREDRKLIN